jgi:hypothetical protein
MREHGSMHVLAKTGARVRAAAPDNSGAYGTPMACPWHRFAGGHEHLETAQ